MEAQHIVRLFFLAGLLNVDREQVIERLSDESDDSHELSIHAFMLEVLIYIFLCFRDNHGHCTWQR